MFERGYIASSILDGERKHTGEECMYAEEEAYLHVY